MPAHSDIDMRMKNNYEFPYRYYLTKRTPVIVRIDGRSFHTFTKGFDKPFDRTLIKCMQITTKYLCENTAGCMVGYQQSDEISLLLIDYDTFYTEAHFGYNVQKIASTTASMATMVFNRCFQQAAFGKGPEYNVNPDLVDHYRRRSEKGAMFDARVFNIPREEVTNYFFSRQLDASRNSIEMVGRAYFSHNQLYKKNGSMIQDMLHEKHDINWNDFPTEQKRGSCCIKKYYIHPKTDTKDKYSDVTLENYDYELAEQVKDYPIIRSKWVIDHEIPQFKGEGREYIERFVNPDVE